MAHRQAARVRVRMGAVREGWGLALLSYGAGVGWVRGVGRGVGVGWGS